MKQLIGVADTLYIPLEGRIFCSKKFPEFFYDKKALSIESHIPDTQIQKKSSEYAFMASAARYYHMDQIARRFAEKNNPCNLVYLGCGLETAAFRLENLGAHFYSIDLPNVICRRRSILGENPKETLIGADMFSFSWAKELDASLPTLFLVSGVFQYFKEVEVLSFIRGLKKLFSKAELVFDAVNKEGLSFANRYVRKTGNKDALMQFYVNDSTQFAAEANTTLVEERAYFTDARRLLKRKLGLFTRIAMKVVDDKKRVIIIHLELNK